MLMQTLTFLDVEASGLDDESYPIQIGWIDTNGDYDEFLINPETASSWTYWNKIAEKKYHGLTRERCVKEGLSIFDAAQRLNRLLRGVVVTSDAPDYDTFWIIKLMNECGCEPSFCIQDVRELLNSLQVPLTPFFAERKLRIPEHNALSDCVRNIHSGAACGYWGVSDEFTSEFGEPQILVLDKELS
ncbi:hypothetical protein [Vibrio sp. D431a]|uniref:hypothetical protein n=1 Tax=Vibrio sp. D431a TaxID=2837388 RepID=UPI00255481D6|nr:hypothetical protein [Vibrio sp. D431a]MDK9790149.1 hypothetical protein [Vibrio sp. D431a]